MAIPVPALLQALSEYGFPSALEGPRDLATRAKAFGETLLDHAAEALGFAVANPELSALTLSFGVILILVWATVLR